MPSLKDIRLRIDSTKNTQQITKALKMVSAAKLRRAQLNIVNLRPYANSMMNVIADVATTQKVKHKLLERPEVVRKVLLVVVSSDRGLCGGFNANINKFTNNYLKENRDRYEKMDLLIIGKKTAEFFKRRGVNPVDSILNLAKDISFGLASQIAQRVVNAYQEGEYDEVQLVFNEFKSAIQQNVVCETLLPLEIEKHGTINSGVGGFPPDMIFEPNPAYIVDQLVKKHFSVQVYRCLSESIAAEHGARMTSMENATKNAGELIRTLTLTYNKARQAAITTELIEITSGAEALKA